MGKSLVGRAKRVNPSARLPPSPAAVHLRDTAVIHPCYPSATVFRNCHAVPALAIATLKSSGQYFRPGLADPARNGVAAKVAAVQGNGAGP